MQSYDYIIVGGGSAGCVLANRLSQNPNTTVLLLEAGGSDKSIFIQMPSALSIPMNMKKYNWFYYSEPEPNLNHRRLHCPRGKVIGGSSSINGMAYVRGNPMDYEAWQESGAIGWGFEDVLPYFKRAESYPHRSAYRGAHGPLKVTRGAMRNPLYQAFVQAGVEAGYTRTQDMNGFAQEGFGAMDMTVYKHQRWSAAKAYLDPIKQRKNLNILKKAFVTRVLISDKQAKGLEFIKFGRKFQVSANKEVILSAGPINSPSILMHSGIGPSEHLLENGVQVIHHLPGVGQNLMDHLELYIQYACKQPVSLYPALKPLAKAWIGTKWLMRAPGLGSTNHFESGGFIRSDKGVAWPNIQFHFLPLAISYDGQAMANQHGFQAHVGPMRSLSRGWVKIHGSDPLSKPKVLFNYMSHEQDWVEMRACVRLTREIFQQPAFDPYRGEELAPGSHVQIDADIDNFIRDKVESAYHPCGTCKMGRDVLSVVDPECRVYGIKKLRVVDSSIMPQITTGNLNAPTIMLAEKAADHILNQPMLKESLAYYQAQSWQDKQRESAALRVI